MFGVLKEVEKGLLLGRWRNLGEFEEEGDRLSCGGVESESRLT